ncbi:MAG TPA: EAL domain-containing protein [Pseudomonadales bacterium]
MAQVDFRRVFDQSTVAQWILDIQPMQAWLAERQFADVMALQQALADASTLGELRDTLAASAINRSGRALLGLSGDEDFSAILRRYAADEHIRQLAEAVLQLGDTAQVYSYQISLTLDPAAGRQTLLISCTVPALGQLDDGALVTAMDISTLASAETELDERERFVSATLKAVPDILMVYDLASRTPVFQNQSLAAELGYTELDIKNTNNRLLDYITHPDDRLTGELFADISRTLAAGGIYQITMRMQHNNGQWRHYFFRAAVLDKNDDGSPRTAVVIARDITDVLETRQILSEQQRRYRLLADNFTDVVLVLDKHLAIQYISPSLQDCLGYSPEQLAGADDAMQRLGLAPHLSQLAAMLAATPVSPDSEHDDASVVLETDACTDAGTTLPVEARISILRDEYQLLEGLLIVLRDIHRRRQMETELRLAARVFENSQEGIYITDSNGRIVQANQAFYRITGFQPQQVIGNKPSALSSGWHNKSFADDIRPALDADGFWSGELMSRRASGEAFLIWISICRVQDNRGDIIGTITTFRDITEAKSSEENIRKLAYYDPLTELPNRQLFSDRLSQAIQRANRNRQYLAILFLDLDGFKDVNDRLGHAVGDRLLHQVGKRLKDCIRSDDTVARMGGDEFTVVLNALADRDAAENAAAQVAGKVISRLNEPFLIDDKEAHIGTSIGIALYPDDANEDEVLVKMADTAMYHAKRSGKNQYQFFTDDMHRRTEKRLQIEKDILAAVDNNEFMLAYQPKLITASQHLYGFEALLRWQHPERGLLAPASFMRSLDELGLGETMGRWVLEQACRQLQQWLQQGGHVCSVSVNVFAKHFHDGQLADDIGQAIRRTGITPELLTVEIPEALIMADMGYAYATIADLKDLGVRVALDHFAGGLLSVPYLSRLPIDEVKIDRQFVEDIDRNPRQARLVKTLVMMARNLNLDVVAEGVERQSQLQLLQQAGCNKVQGYLFCQPVYRQALDSYLHAHAARHEALIRPPA